MNEVAAVRWLHRRAGFGLPPAARRAAEGAGASAELDRLLVVDPAALADPWDDAELPLERKDNPSRRYAISTWLDQMVAAEQPLAERMAWLWHGHLVSGLDKAKIGRLMVGQVRLFRSTGLGSFPALLRAVTIDPAMMLYLDLNKSTGAAPNENFAREVLELFTLGVGNFAESDVHAGAVALSGWRLTAAGGVELVPRRHDPTAQHYLGVDGVHDLDSVVAAIAAQPAMPRFIAAAVAGELLGVTSDEVVAPLAEQFAAGGFDVATLVRATLQAGLAGASASIVLAPVPWLVTAQRVCGATIDAGRRLLLLRSAGQLPMLPPNVAGWPGGPAWFGSSSLVARVALAELVAKNTAPDAEAMAAATSGSTADLAAALGLPDGDFGAVTVQALGRAGSPAERLALALVSPEFMIA